MLSAPGDSGALIREPPQKDCDNMVTPASTPTRDSVLRRVWGCIQRHKVGATVASGVGVVGSIATVVGVCQGRQPTPTPTPLANEYIDAPDSTSGSVLVAKVGESRFRMPRFVYDHWVADCQRIHERVDSALTAADFVDHEGGDVAGIFDEECSGERPALRYFNNLRRLTEIDLRNEGDDMARSVAVWLPLQADEWWKGFGDMQTISWQPVTLPYTIEVGDLRPGEGAHISVWSGFSAIDSVGVSQASGRTLIERRTVIEPQ